ncbi:MAG: transcription termination/antitermination factor NusG [Lentisphaerae bacterium GWF2_52_8]|nr:MAG: transcription termination/antitermination factor NusG [Lentisphaerae bacterium GWF2_52_8]
MDRSNGQWFVVHTLSGQENKVKEGVEKQIQREDAGFGVYEVLVPTEKVSEVRQGKKTTTTRKYFPGYVLIRMDLYNPEGVIDEKVWYFIRQTQGVIGFVGGAGDRPLPLAAYEVEDLLRQVEGREDKAKPKIMFEIGETVRIKDGAFENFEGAIEEIDSERGKLKLMVSIFGRSTPVELEFWQVGRE